METENHKEISDTFKKFPLLLGFDHYYLGFFKNFLRSECSLQELIEPILNIVQLHNQEILSDLDKVKSLVRIFTKKIKDPCLISELSLKIDKDSQGRITLKDYFLSIKEILLQYKKISPIELYYIGEFHAMCPSYHISDIFRDINQINEVIHSSGTPEEKVISLLLKTLNKKLKDSRNVEIDKNTESIFQDDSFGQRTEVKKGVKRKAEEELEGIELKQVRINKNEFVEDGLITINLSHNSSRRTGITKVKVIPCQKDKCPALELERSDNSSLSNHTTEMNHGAANPAGKSDNNEDLAIPSDLLEIIEWEQKQHRKKMKEDDELSRSLIEQLLQEDQREANSTAQEEEEKSRILIEQLQELEEKEKIKRQEQQDEKNAANCAICLDDLYSTTFKPLEGCSHVFHEECMQEYLKSKIDDKAFPILCPELECKAEIVLNDVTDFLDDKYQEKFESFSWKAYLERHTDEISCCPTADCNFAFIKEDDQNQLECPVCKKHYCLNCRVTWHKGMTCKEYEVTHKKDENDEKFDKFLKGQKFKQCPKCGVWVSKVEGCNAIICRCTAQFCYDCGREGDGHYCPCLNIPRAPPARTQGRRRRRN